MGRIGIIGFGSLGKQLYNMLLEQGAKEQDILIFDDNSDVDHNQFFRFSGYADFREDTKFFVTLGYNHLVLKREMLSSMGKQSFNIATFVHPTTYIHPLAEIGKGVILFPHCVIEQNTIIGDGCICYDATVVAHDCVISESVFMAPNVTVCGNTRVDECVFIGASTTIANNLNIGAESKIGMSSAVQNNIPSKTYCIGNPLKLIEELTVR